MCIKQNSHGIRALVKKIASGIRARRVVAVGSSLSGFSRWMVWSEKEEEEPEQAHDSSVPGTAPKPKPKPKPTIRDRGAGLAQAHEQFRGMPHGSPVWSAPEHSCPGSCASCVKHCAGGHSLKSEAKERTRLFCV